MNASEIRVGSLWRCYFSDTSLGFSVPPEKMDISTSRHG